MNNTASDIVEFYLHLLVAVNPYADLPLYGAEIIEKYHRLHGHQDLPPHLYGRIHRDCNLKPRIGREIVL